MKRAGEGNIIGTVDQSFDGFVFEPEATLESPLMTLGVNLGLHPVWEMIKNHGRIIVDLETEIDMSVGSYPIKIKYVQKRVTCWFRFFL